MRYKVVPEPRGFETLLAVHDVLPLVPDSVEDCCIRVVDRTDVPARDDAREWITFCQALDLAEETSRGFQRVRTEPDRAALAGAFDRRVFGVAEVRSALVDGERLTVDEAFDALRPAIPQWERDRHTDWEAEWRERTRRLLEWSVVFGLADVADGAYRATS